MDLRYDFGPDPADPARQVEQLERLLSCFQKALGHELPNQLVALQGLARLIEMEQADRLDDEGRAHLLRLADLARRTDGLVRALAEIGRLTRERGTAEVSSLSDIAREAAAEVSVSISGWSIRYAFDPEATTLPVSPRNLRLALVHLVRNAVQAGGGRASHVEIGSRRGADGIEWWVKDDGRGLTEAQAPRLFECFTGGATAGLGLFVVRQLVAQWGGALRVHSEPDAGATITVLVRTP
jgi:two-component system, OmpR family, sensor histidine kinase TctE